MNKPNATIQSILMHLVGETSIPSQTNLWPSVEVSLLKRNFNSLHKDKKMDTNIRKGRRLVVPAAIMLTLLLAAIFLLVTPLGQTWAQGILDFFTQDQDDIQPISTPVPVGSVDLTPGVGVPTKMLSIVNLPILYDQCGGYGMTARCTIQEIQALVPFQVYQLGQIPDGLYFVGASGNSEVVWVAYETYDNSGSLIIYEEPWTGDPDQSAFFTESAFEIGASAEFQETKINGIAVEFVKGSYTNIMGEKVAVWDGDSGIQTIRWVDHGILFTIRKIGDKPKMDFSTLSALVATMTSTPESIGEPFRELERTEPASDLMTQIYAKSIEEAEQEIGYSLRLPTKLIENLTLVGVSLEEWTWPVVFYRSTGTNGLSVSQQPIPESGECDLCGFIRGTSEDLETNNGHRIVGMDAQIEEVQIGDLTGQYVIGVWEGTNAGWVWKSYSLTPRRLRWQSDGTAYELILWSSNGKDKSYLIAIAENMIENSANDSETSDQTLPDPELKYLPAVLAEVWAKPVEQAENEAGFTMHLPSRLPENLIQIGALYEFDHPYIEVFYWMKGDWTDGLRVVEQPIPDSGICDLCGFTKGELDTKNSHWIVGMNAEIHDVQIGEINGQFIRGKWVYENNAAVWKTTEDIKRLRWQKNGIAFELIYQGMALDKQDLISIAQTIP